MSDELYKMEITVQAWRTDPYYVGSSQPIEHVTVVAHNHAEGKKLAEEALYGLRGGYYWRFWIDSATDLRLLPPVSSVGAP